MALILAGNPLIRLAAKEVATGQRTPVAFSAATEAPPPQGLPALLNRVLTQDPQIRVAESSLQVAEERRLQARSRLGPTVAVSSARGNAQEIEFGRPLERRTERTEAVFRWNLVNAGSDKADLAGATLDVDAAMEAKRQAQEEVAERLALAYIDVLKLQDLLPRAAERLAEVRALAQQVQRQTELGKASDADVQQIKVSLLDAEIAHELLASDHESARKRLVALVGGDVGPLLPIAMPVESPGMVAAAALKPGVVAAADVRAQAARARVRPFSWLLAPRVDFEARQRLSDRTLPQSTTEQQSSWLLTARWDLPLGGELQARRAEAEHRAEATEWEAERISQLIHAEWIALGPRAANAERAAAQLGLQIEQYVVLLRAAKLQFEAGRRTLAQLVLLHDGRFNAEQRRSEQVHRLQTNRLRQLALTGFLLPALEEPPSALALAPVSASHTAMAVAPIPSTAEAPVSMIITGNVAFQPSAATAGASRNVPTGEVSTEVGQALAAWARAWSERRVEDYVGAYVPGYTPPEGRVSNTEWELQRRSRIRSPRFIDVALSDIRLQTAGEGVVASFQQHYRSDRLAERSRKRLLLTRVEGRWLIKEEAVLNELERPVER